MEQVIYRTAREYKRAWWARALIQSKQDRLQTGITVAEWCEKNRVSIKSYWYYHKQLGDELAILAGSTGLEEPGVPAAAQNTCGGTVFAELADPGQIPECTRMHAPAVICRGDIRIEIPDSVSDEFLVRILKAVSHV